MQASNNGKLNDIDSCKITVPHEDKSISNEIILNNLPEISDSKTAIYNGNGIMGRSFPLYTYSHSGDRTISLQLHFFIVNQGDGQKNLNYLRLLQSALYPREGVTGAPYMPPPVCTIECGRLLGDEPLCAILQSCSVKFPTDVAWEKDTLCPFRFDVDTSWLTVYQSSDLPYQSTIIKSGR